MGQLFCAMADNSMVKYSPCPGEDQKVKKQQKYNVRMLKGTLREEIMFPWYLKTGQDLLHS